MSGCSASTSTLAKISPELLSSELIQNCPALATAEALTGAGEDTRLYHFVRRPVLPSRTIPAFQGIELNYLLTGLERMFGGAVPAHDAALADLMRTTWTRFADDQAIVVPDPSWPAHTLAATTHLEWLGPDAVLKDEYRDGRCAALFAAFLAFDGDGDRVGNANDSCPYIANSNQIDGGGAASSRDPRERIDDARAIQAAIRDGTALDQICAAALLR